MMRQLIRAVVVLSCAVETHAADQVLRHGRAIVRTAEGTRQRASMAVSCLAYVDDKRLFVEVAIRNHGGPASFTPPPVVVKQGDRIVRALDLSRVAEEIHAAAVRDFVPVATASDDRSTLHDQIKRHLEAQEREENFALLLTTLADDPPKSSLAPGDEHTSIHAFHRPRGPFDVEVKLGAEPLRFRFDGPESPSRN